MSSLLKRSRRGRGATGKNPNSGTGMALTAPQMLWLLLGIALAIVPHWSNLPTWFWPVAAVVLLWRLRSLEKPLPRWQVLLVTSAVLLAIGVSAGHGLNREIAITILASMAVLKTLESQRRRDAWVLIALGFFLVMTRFFYGQDMVLLPWLFLTVATLTYALLCLNQCHGPKSWFVPKILSQALRYLLLAVPVAAALFLFFPRLASPLWGSPEMFGQGKTGLGDSMSPGSIAELFMDDSPAMRINFADKRPDAAQLYWRGPVLESFDGTTWRAIEYTFARRPPPLVDPQAQVAYDIELEPHGQHFLPVLDYPFRVPETAFLMPDLHVQQATRVNQLKHYHAVSQTVTPLPDTLPARLARRLVMLPRHANPKTRAMITSWQAQTPDTQALIERILTWFNQENFVYTFTPPPLKGDTVDQFLFETRAGFCEHYASAFTVMMRMAGVPARVVTGYQGGLDNGSYWLVRQSDAHAWSEVWLKGRGWLRVDPTAAVAPSRVRSGARSWMDSGRTWYDYGWLHRLQLSLDSWRYRWNRWLRDYNQETQRKLLESLGVDDDQPAGMAWLIAGAILTSGLLGLFALGWSRQKRQVPDVEKIFRQLEKQFSRLGLPRAPHEGPATYLERVARHWPQTANDARCFAREYERLRYAPDVRTLTIKDKPLQSLQEAAENLMALVRGASVPVKGSSG